MAQSKCLIILQWTGTRTVFIFQIFCYEAKSPYFFGILHFFCYLIEHLTRTDNLNYTFKCTTTSCDVDTRLTCWLLCSCIVMTLLFPHSTTPKSSESVDTVMSGIVTTALILNPNVGPLSTLKGTCRSTGPMGSPAALGSKVTMNSILSLSGSPGRLRTRSNSTPNPLPDRTDLSGAKDTGKCPLLVTRTTCDRTVPYTTYPKSRK